MMALNTRCTSLDEVRSNIDRIDRQLVALIAERGAFVRQAAAFKKTAAEVPAPQRVAQVLAHVRALAGESGADPAVVEATWRAMIGAFIEAERVEQAMLRPPSPH
ncbi:chorismate mutase [Dechloromonas hortensis]|uniref:chorismate mutase n=1 Tax=Dechloromonas hortensis TaxID=337779 RepID=UPI001B8838B4|nr:chorismate mutase [Dechloromonas hortensis]